MKDVLVNVSVEILVSVDDDVSLDDASTIALFNCDGIIPSIGGELNKKMKEIEILEYQVISSDEC